MEPWLDNFARANFRRSSDTAHDLKTPLNVAVLNLELLRMRIRKLLDGDDEKILGYASCIEVELRRMARIFDAFFLLSTPPKGGEEPAAVDLAALCADFDPPLQLAGTAFVTAHESRIRQALKLFIEGACRLLASDGRTIAAVSEQGEFRLICAGRPASAEDFELTRIFKFYYTDPSGNPDLSLATARLIAETYGGELNATQESDKVTLRLSFPLGER